MAIDLMQFMTRPTQNVEGTVNEPVNNEVASSDLPGENSVDFSRYGVTENGNKVGFTKLNKLMDEDGIGANDQKRYEVQQQWLKNLDTYIEMETNPDRKAAYQQARERIGGKALQEDSFWNYAKHEAGAGVDQMQARLAYGAAAALDKASDALPWVDSDYDVIKKENPELFAKYEKAKLHKDNYTAQMAMADPNFDPDGWEKGLSPDEVEAYKEFEKQVSARFDKRFYTGKGYLSKTFRHNMQELAKDANIAGYDEFQKKLEESPWSTAASLDGFGKVIATGLRSTASQAPELVSGILLGAATGGTAGFLAFQTMSASSNMSIEAIQGVMDYTKERYMKETGKSIADITDDELIDALGKYSDDGSLDKAFKDGLISGAATAAGEGIAGLVTGTIGAKLMKYGLKPDNVKTAMGRMAIGAGVGTEVISECIEESSGQIAQNLQKGEPWNKGVSQSCVQGLLSIENGMSTVGSIKGARSDIKAATQGDTSETTQPQGEQTAEPAVTQDPPPVEQTTTNTQQPPTEKTEEATSQVQPDSELDRASELLSNIERNVNGEYVNESGENTALLDPQGAIQQQFSQFNAELDQIMTDKGYDPTDLDSRKAFVDMLNSRTGNVNVIAGTDAIIEEARPLYDKLRAGTITDEELTRYEELEQQYANETARVVDGLEVRDNLQLELNRQQDNTNEDRNINRNGTENADGSSIEQGLNEPNGSGTQSSSEVSNTVSPTETTTTATGDSQSDSGVTADITEQPDDNSQQSGAVGANGRTGNTVGQGVEQGTSGENGITQIGEPTEATQSGSENSGVQQRTQSDSVGETLNVSNLSNTQLRKNIKQVSERLRNSSSYANSGGAKSQKLADDRSRLESLLDESAKRMGVESKAKTILDRIAKETKYDDVRENDSVFGMRAAQAEAILSKMDDISSTINKGYSKTKDALAAVREKLKGLLEDIYTYLATFPGRTKNYFANRKKAKDKARREDWTATILDEIVHYAEGLQPKKSDEMKRFSAWSVIADRNLTNLREAIQRSLHLNNDGSPRAVKKDETIDVLLNDFTRDTSRDGKGVVMTLDGNTVVDRRGGDKTSEPTQREDNKPANTQAEPRQERESTVSNERAKGNSPSDTAAQSKPVKQERATKSERKDGNDKGFLDTDKGSFATKAELNKAMQDEMRKHPDNAELNAAVFEHAASIANQHKGRKGWSKKEELSPPKGAKVNLTDILGQSEKAIREQTDQRPKRTEQQMPDPIKRENERKRAVDNAIAIADEQANPFAKEFGSDFKNNQRKAHQLFNEHKGDKEKVAKIKEAFLKSPLAREQSWNVAQRGYHIFNDKNPNHKELAKKLGHKPYGVDFDNHPVYRNEKEIYKDLQEENTTASQITLTLAEEPKTGMTAVERAVNNFFKNEDNRQVEQDMRQAVEDYATEHNFRETDDSPILGTEENLAWAANNEHFVKKWVGERLRPFFENLQKVIAAVVAVVAVGAMTVPTDAMAQQGFSTYTQGETIKGVSQDASNTINWVMQHKDHNGKNFVVADKDQGKIHIVSPDGKVLDTQNALFGKGRGNDNSDMNTPSGRMQLKKETNLNKTERGIYGDSVLEFVQPETKASVKQKGGGLLAMHRVVNKPERKAALNSATASDNYLSHGCVNIPTAFYNTAVDSLDGAMVYVLDHKEPKQAKQATKEVKQTTTQSGLTYSKSSLSQSPSGLKMQRSGLSVQTPSKLSIADVNYEEHGLSKPEVKKTLKKVLGDLADRVTLISREDFDAHNADYAYINRNGVEGFFDAETGSVFLVADQIKKGNGLTAPERAAWVAWHELTHAGLDTKYGNDLKQILENVKDDPFVSQLAEAIQLRRASRNDSPAHVSDLGAVEEAIAEINAAVRTGKLNALTERYGLVIPEAYHDFTKEVSKNFLQKLRNLFNKLLGRTAVVSNNQVVELLRSLPQDVEAYAPVASRAITERVLSQLNNPESAYRQAKYSIGETVTETAGKAANYILSNTLYKNQQVLNTAGANPNAVGVGKRQDEVLEQSLNPMEKFIEGMYDSQTAAIKHLGGLKTRYGQMLKTATNRTSQVKTMFQKDLFHLLKNMEKVAKKAYTREDRVAIQNDLQTITTALGSLSGINSKMMENYKRILFDPDYGLETELQSLGVDLETGQANQVMSPWQAKQIGEMWQRYQEMKAIYEKSSQSTNRLMDEKLARKGEDPKRMREDLRMYNGQTTAEAYNRITKAVKAGLLDMTVKGKPWLEYIKDVGFTEDKGFADESKNYDINEKDIELNGHLAPLIDEYTSFAQSIYNYKEQYLGKALVGESFDNRFEVPTMGKVESMKFDVDQDGNFRVKKDKKVEDIVSLEDATEYQSKRLGRALLGGNVISNLNTLIDLTAQQTQYQSLFQALYDQRNDKDAVAVKVFNTTDPEYNLMKGAILHVDILGRNGKPTGKKKYVKVALDNDEATAALFGDNVQEMNITGMNLVRFINKFITMSLTGNPAFSLWNSLRGLWEKLDQIASQFGGRDNAYFMEQVQNSNSATAKLIKSNNAIVSFLRKPALVGIALAKIVRNFFSYIPAASAMAFYMIDKKGKYKHGNLLVGKQKLMFNRLMQAYQQGTISTRAESYRLTPEQLQAMHSSYRGVLGNTFGTAFRSLPRKGVMMLDSLQEYAQFLTTTGELVSTLAIQDVLTDAGMDIDRANEANLFFMNFNDKGAGRASAYLRAAIPFANATAQGNRSTMRSITSKGVSLILYGAVSSYLLQELSNMLQDLYPCDKDVSDNAFENRNDAELQRDIPFRLGCSGEFRLPIGYGIGAISHSIGVGLYQLVHNNWSGEQALKFASHVAAENLLPLPTIPDSKSSPVSIAVKTIAPYPVRVFMNANSGVDDFGNELSSPAAKGKKNRFAFGKATTPEVWTDVAKFLHGVGFNASPEEARYVFQSIFGEIPAGLMNDASKDLKEDETRLGQIAYGLSGGKRIWRKARTPGQDSYIRATNLQDRYEDLVKYIDHAHEVGDENGKLKYGTRDSNLYTWLNKVRATGQYNEREMEIMQYLAEFKREQKRISSKKLTKERKDELHYENNKRLIEMLRPYNKGDK